MTSSTDKELNNRQKTLLQRMYKHARKRRPQISGFKEFFVTLDDSDDYFDCMALVDRGLMDRWKGDTDGMEGRCIFMITHRGHLFVEQEINNGTQ